jgi:hypothetical protein
MKNLTFTKTKTYDKGFGYVTTYSYGNWKVVNLGSEWCIDKNGVIDVTTNTLKEAKFYISLMEKQSK